MTEREMKDLNTRCEMHMTQVHDMFTDIKHCIFGNGTEGLKTRVTRMEMTIKAVENNVKAITEERNKIRWTFYGIAASLLVMTIGALATQFTAYTRAQAIAEQSQKALAQQTQDLNEIKESLAAIEMGQ